ncbi:CRT (chloroquine-resistance transporter)-like transporter [Klebsormidium nitens]|uniref:CRT (Chloroquine-resistance transporter)-like transporter n=1 Tax=Klebsormidium nitens TaxID=105231 RepID=A0A1Y1I3N1_KLENI|nr:CRT (chloroquine-resistance transporter)-like transporter [Klebsormidium nitens]|eukprot:GAQ82708.1 CRT (chloroquine-resistance transporter)-like transporter [Klebsormidium nitens]
MNGLIASSSFADITELTSAGLCDVGTSAPLLGRRRGRTFASASEGGRAEEDASGKTAKIVVAAAMTTALAVANRVLYKVALVPLNEYPFFLAQLTTFGYVLVYFSVLAARKRMGIVTDEMLAIPKKRFVAMGALEAVSLAMGMVAATKLPGAIIPILSQTFIIWQLSLSSLILGTRYQPGQLFGALLVLAGVVIVVASGNDAGSAFQEAGKLYPALYTLSTVFPAASTILKEGVFKEAKEKLKGSDLDLFVVNSFGSGFQAIFVLLLLPFLSGIKGIPFSQLPSYLKAGTACFFNTGDAVGCDGAPWLPFLYVASNLAFNVSALNLLKMSSAIVSSLTMTLAVPLTIFAFTFPIPYLGSPAPLPPGFAIGSAVLILGLLAYNVSKRK